MNKEDVIKEFEIEVELMNYAEYLDLNIRLNKEIVENILTKKNPKDECLYSNENYRHFMDDLRHCNQEFNMLVRHILEEYAPEFLSTEYSLELDFSKCCGYIVKNSNNSCNSCNTGGCHNDKDN